MKYDLSGPQYLNGSGYLVTCCPEHPKAWSNGKVKVHVAVAYEKYGDIPNGYVVHHLDLNKTNNDPNNLILLTELQHNELHWYLKKHPEYIGLCEEETMKLFTEKNISELIKDDIPDNPLLQLELDKQRLEKKLKSKFLTDLEKEQVKKDIKNTQERIRLIRAENNSLPHSKEDLLKVLEEEHNILASSRRFGVSYQTFRNWCKKENIDLDKYVYEPSRHSKVLTKKCPVCGKEFTCTERDEKLYCSKECFENRYSSILTVDSILTCLKDGLSWTDMERKFNITRHTIKKYAKKYNLI